MMKCLFEILVTTLSLLIIWPLVLVLGVLVRVNLGSPVLFRQQRPGLHGKPFMLLKFRTMTEATDSAGRLLPDSERLTMFGRFLRGSSLDELPELFNVLRGEMSLVGPRPLLMEYLPRYTLEQARRHEVKPGITGWAQVNGRQTISFSRRIELDVWYVDHQSFWLDLWILLITVPRILMSTGIRSGQDVREVDDLSPASHSENQHGN
ncbi:MAG: sugar transferase [Pirellulaceae bacterium]